MKYMINRFYWALTGSSCIHFQLFPTFSLLPLPGRKEVGEEREKEKKRERERVNRENIENKQGVFRKKQKDRQSKL